MAGPTIAIRLGVQGGAEVRRALDEVGQAGEAAFRTTGAAAEAAGTATEKQIGRWQRLAQAAREAGAAADARARFDSVLGVTAPSSGSARDSAAVFEAEAKRVEAAQHRLEEVAASGRAAQQSVLRQTIVPDRGADIKAYGAELDRLRAKFDPLFAAGQQYKALLADIEAAAKTGAISESGRAAAITRTKTAFVEQVDTIRKADARGGNLRPDQLQNLLMQGGDVIAQSASGTSPLTILLQQGPQVAQVFGPGQGGVTGILKGVGEAIASVVSPARLALGTVAAIGIALASTSGAYAAQQREIERSITGIGRASGVTVGQINAVASASAGAGGVSVSAARDMAASFAATGKIGGELYSGLIASTRDYASQTGQDLPEASAALAQAFADPAKGAKALDERLAFLNATTRENIDRMAAQGDRMGAQKALFDAFTTSLTKADERLGFFARQWEAFKNTTSDEVDAVGRVIDRVTGGGDLEERLAQAQQILQNTLARQRTFSFLPFDSGDLDKARAALKVLDDLVDARQRASAATASNERGKAVDLIVKGLNPATERAKQLEDSAENIGKFLREGGVDKDGSSRRAMDALLSAAKQLRTDLASGGAELADRLRASQLALATVGNSESSRRLIDVNERARRDVLAIERSDADPETRAARLRSIEDLRRNEEAAARETTLRTTGSYRTNIRDVPEQYRDTVQRAADARGVDPNLLASVFRQESRFRPEVISGEVRSSAGATGGFQFMPGTARQYGIDPTDLTQSADAAALFLRRALDSRKGDVGLALADYNYGAGNVDKAGRDPARFPAETRNYIAEILQQSPAVAETVTALRDRQRALEDEKTIVDINSRYLGQNGLELEKATRAQQAMSEMIARGVPVTDALKSTIAGLASESATTAQRMKAVQFASDIGFEREQLGRNASEQVAFSRARSVFGDTSSPAARFAIDQALLNDNLRETKVLASDAFKGFANDLMKGKSAGEAFASVLDKVSDKLLSMATDNLMSAAFGAKGGGAGVFGSLLSAVGFGASGSSGASGAAEAAARGVANPALYGPGFAVGGYTGNADARQPVGIVHGREYVFDATATSRIGVQTLEAIRRGARGYADGGYVNGWSAPASGTMNDNVTIRMGDTHISAPGGDTATINAMLDARDRKMAAQLSAMIRAARGRGSV